MTDSVSVIQNGVSEMNLNRKTRLSLVLTYCILDFYLNLHLSVLASMEFVCLHA